MSQKWAINTFTYKKENGKFIKRELLFIDHL